MANGSKNFENPIQNAVDVYLADGGSSVELLALLAEVAAYAAPQTRPDDGEENEGEYAELAEALAGLAEEMNGRGSADAAVAELLAWAKARGLEAADVDELVTDGLLAEASAVNNGGLGAQFRHLVEKWGPDVNQLKFMIAGGER